MAQFDSLERVERNGKYNNYSYYGSHNEHSERGSCNDYNSRPEPVQIEDLTIDPTDVMTGGRDQSRFLYYQLKMSMMKAKQIDIIVSFLMESGVRMILSDIKAALERGAKVRILTGNYLGITQPSALYLIKKELGDQVDLRFYHDKGRSFHPKSYIFHYENMEEIYIGSSNISRSALTSGIEWNYRFNSLTDQKNFRMFYHTFEELFFIIPSLSMRRNCAAIPKTGINRLCRKIWPDMMILRMRQMRRLKYSFSRGERRLKRCMR